MRKIIPAALKKKIQNVMLDVDARIDSTLFSSAKGLREPTLRSAFKLADALGVSVEEFRDGAEEDASSPETRPRFVRAPSTRGLAACTLSLGR